MDRSILIIGGGVSGLCTGCFARMNGYKTTILEMNNKAGGLCASWKRDDYTIDVCMHFLMGAADETTDLYKGWRSLGILSELDFVFPPILSRVVDRAGREIIFYADVEKLEKHLLEVAPEDAEEIGRMICAIKALAKADVGLRQPHSFWESICYYTRLIPALSPLKHYSALTLAEWGSQFKNPLLSRAISSWWDPRMSALLFLLFLAWANKGVFGYPIGGSDAFVRALEMRYRELGGIIKYQTTVSKILVENNRAIGVQLASGEQLFADDVISAADGYTTIFEMLEGRYVNAQLVNRYHELPVFSPQVCVVFGVNQTFPAQPGMLNGTTFEIPRTQFGNRTSEWLSVKITTDRTLVPAGKTLITCAAESDLAFWEELAKDPAAYQKARDELAATVLTLLETRFPGISVHIELTEVITPWTFKKYTNNWQASYEGWLPTPKTMLMHMEKTLPGLRNFHMVGQWVQPGGGFPGCLMTAQEVVSLLCKRDGLTFYRGE